MRKRVRLSVTSETSGMPLITRRWRREAYASYAAAGKETLAWCSGKWGITLLVVFAPRAECPVCPRRVERIEKLIL